MFQELLPSQLNVDYSCQRQPDLKRLHLMVKSFDRHSRATITVVKRADGSYWCVDGICRLSVLAAVGLGNEPVRCQIYEGLSREEEALLFPKLKSTKYRKLSRDELYRAIKGSRP